MMPRVLAGVVVVAIVFGAAFIAGDDDSNDTATATDVADTTPAAVAVPDLFPTSPIVACIPNSSTSTAGCRATSRHSRN